jgi:hypothetical protein
VAVDPLVYRLSFEQTVRVALDSWPGTARLCLIYLTMNIPVDVLASLISTDSPT